MMMKERMLINKSRLSHLFRKEGRDGGEQSGEDVEDLPESGLAGSAFQTIGG